MYIAIDGDSVGIQLQKLILEERLEELACFSNTIKDTLQRFVWIIESHGGIVYMSGGDNIFAEGDRECIQAIVTYVQIENKRNQLNYSLAVGMCTQDAYIGLNYAKSSKLNYIEVTRNFKNVEFRQII